MDDILSQFLDTITSLVALSKRELRILASVRSQIDNNIYLTEKQANMVKLILNQYMDSTQLSSSKWRYQFRTFDMNSRLYIDGKYIVLECAPNKKIQSKLKKFGGIGPILTKGRTWYFTLHEKNIVELTKSLKNLVTVDDAILTLSKQILALSPKTTFTIDDNAILKTSLEKELGSIDNILLTIDRQHRFKYSVTTNLIHSDTLECKIASRENTSVFIDSTVYSLESVFEALTCLKRLPVLIVVDSATDNTFLLDALNSILPPTTKVGVYFRYNKPNSRFNSLINEYGYNTYLDETVDVVVLNSTKLPKIMLKAGWYPMSTIWLTNHYANRIVDVYCNGCDLQICYNTEAPLHLELSQGAQFSSREFRLYDSKTNY